MTKKKNYYKDKQSEERPLSKKEVSRERDRKKVRNLDNAIRSNNISQILTTFEDEED